MTFKQLSSKTVICEHFDRPLFVERRQKVDWQQGNRAAYSAWGFISLYKQRAVKKLRRDVNIYLSTIKCVICWLTTACIQVNFIFTSVRKMKQSDAVCAAPHETSTECRSAAFFLQFCNPIWPEPIRARLDSSSLKWRPSPTSFMCLRAYKWC